MNRRPRRGRRHIRHLPGSPALETLGLTVYYQDTVALQNATIRLDPGDHLAVLGPNGAGKSTLLKAVAGVISPTEGEIRVYGHGPRGHLCIAYLPQRSAVDWTFPVNVRDVVTMGRTGRLPPWRRIDSSVLAQVEESMAQVGLEHLADRQIGELSGGEQQRMFIARALAQQAELFLLDEPLAGLDAGTQEELLRLVGEFSGTTVVVAMHELGVAQGRFPQVLLLNRRVVGMGPPHQVLTAERLKEAYGRALQIVRTDDGTLLVGDSCCPPEEPKP
ncbi:MAG: metal ABC transporter ATP-binding protein [Candidatus Bipolaricaulota bacterium]